MPYSSLHQSQSHIPFIMAAVDSSVLGLLSTLTASLSSAVSSLPSDHTLLLPPTDGISLLDTKNELLLSYIQNLVFLVILKLRQASDSETDHNAAAIKKLVELRVYTERGVRPLEGRLKYQIEKVLRAADDAEKSAVDKVNSESKRNGRTIKDGEADEGGTEDSESDIEGDPTRPDDLSYRPNPAALLRKAEPKSNGHSATSHKDSTYKPPRITPTSMPQSASSTRESNASRRQRKSHLLDEYVSAELSSAPLAEPSIGSNSTILNRGRSSLNARERDKQRERMEYEERNLARLPGESKAEKRKAKARGEGPGRKNEYGGEDWTGLGEVGDRVARSVGRGSSKGGVLERREKRGRDDGDRGGGGIGIGDAFEKRRRVMEGRAERKGKKGR